jgi:hypothetical protein
LAARATSEADSLCNSMVLSRVINKVSARFFVSSTLLLRSSTIV